jgi:hypothetical protein
MWQKVIRPVLRLCVRLLGRTADLLFLGVLLLLFQEQVDPSSPIAAANWRPWIILNISAAAALRGRSLGLGPHPGLRLRGGGRLWRLILSTAAPWWVWFAVAAIGGSEPALRTLAWLSLLGLVGMTARRRRLRTAWTPKVQGPAILVLLGLGALLGLLYWAADPTRTGSTAALACAAMFAVSLALGDPRNLSQRWASWEGDPGKAVPRREIFGLASLVVLPAVVLEWVATLLRLSDPRAGDLPGDGFVWAGTATAYVMLWAAITWRKDMPRGIAGVLREVSPAGGIERRGERGEALDFSEAPRGALAVEPLMIERRPRFHPWYVPVDSGRAASAELGARELWQTWEPSGGHALGDARCTEDGIPGIFPLPQWDEVAIEPQAPDSREALGADRAGVRRQVILRPFRRFLHPPLSLLPATFAWESPSATQLHQLNTGSTLRLADGDVLVLSASGLVRCFQFEAGCALDLGALRHIPQPEDYLKADS